MESLKINKIVDKLYNKNGLMQKYGGEFFLRKVPETNLYAKGCFFQDFYDLGQNRT